MSRNRGTPPAVAGARSAQPRTGNQITFKLNVPAYATSCAEAWHASEIKLEVGQRVAISATGAIALSNYSRREGPPDGLVGIPADASYLAPGLDRYALVARIGTEGAPFQVGTHTAITIEDPGELFLGVNDEWFKYNSGSFDVEVQIAEAGGAD